MSSTNQVVVRSVIIARDGHRLSPPIGKAFAFTEEEVKAVKAANPLALRDAKNEEEEASLAEVMTLSASPARAAQLRLERTGAGKTTAMANGADGAAPTGQSGQGGAGVLTIPQIKEGVADLSSDELTEALNAERAGAKRAGAISVYEAEIERRKTADDDL